MASGGELIGRLTPSLGGGNFIDIVMWITVGSVVLMLCGGFLYYMMKKRKNYNLKVEFRLPRDVRVIEENGKRIVLGTIKKEWGKGFYDAKTGVVYVVRKKLKPVAMKAFDIKRFLSDSNILTVIQVGIEDYKPVLEDSYLMGRHMESGDEAALIDVKIDTTESKSWKNSYERERIATYTIAGFLQQHGQLVGFGFILISIFVGFAIVYSKIR